MQSALSQLPDSVAYMQYIKLTPILVNGLWASPVSGPHIYGKHYWRTGVKIWWSFLSFSVASIFTKVRVSYIVTHA